MTLGDLLKRVNLEEDKDKVILISDGLGWTNVDKVDVTPYSITIVADTLGSPFSSDR